MHSSTESLKFPARLETIVCHSCVVVIDRPHILFKDQLCRDWSVSSRHSTKVIHRDICAFPAYVHSHVQGTETPPSGTE